MKIASYFNVNGVKVSTQPVGKIINQMHYDFTMGKFLMDMQSIKRVEDQIIIDLLGIPHERNGSLKAN